MKGMGTERLDALKALVERNPGDSRVRYMLAMELGNGGDLEAALEQHRQVLAADPAYVAAYFQAGQTLEKLGRDHEARQIYQDGIAAASNAGDGHAASELQAALDALG